MPKEHPRWGGARPKAGRPKDRAKTVRALQAEGTAFAQEVTERLRKEISRGLTGGLFKLADKFPIILERLIAKAIDDNDTDAQKFLADKFFKMFQPDMVVVSKDTPMSDFLKQVRHDLETASALANSSGERPQVIEGVVRQDGDEGPILRLESIQAVDGGRTKWQELHGSPVWGSEGQAGVDRDPGS